MPKITFLGAGSTIFAKSVLGDCILTPEIENLFISLHDIDPVRLEDSRNMIENLARTAGRQIKLTASLDRAESLKGADYVVNAIQVGGYEPCTVTDFDIPKKYGLRQTIGDTVGIGGIFRALRTIPVLDDFMRDMERVCPNALFINYTNPMAMLTGYIGANYDIRSVGLCHSVQVCAKELLEGLGMDSYVRDCRWKIAGINHMSWLLEITDAKGNDLYPEIRRRARDHLAGKASYPCQADLVRLDMMLKFGYYITESSEHNAEYHPYYIKSNYPEFIERYNIPLDEYITRCIRQIADWEEQRKLLVTDQPLKHEKSDEFAAGIIQAMETDKVYRIHGNVLNDHLIDNLPYDACVEVPCLVDHSGITPCRVGRLPDQLAALNSTNIGQQLMAVEAAKTRKKEYIYMAAMLDPHCAAELSQDQICAMVDDLIKAHGVWLPQYA